MSMPLNKKWVITYIRTVNIYMIMQNCRVLSLQNWSTQALLSNSVTSKLSVRVSGFDTCWKHFRLSLVEWVECTILDLSTIMVQRLLSFRHFENFGLSLVEWVECTALDWSSCDYCPSTILKIWDVVWGNALKNINNISILKLDMWPFLNKTKMRDEHRDSLNLVLKVWFSLPQQSYSNDKGGNISLLVLLLTHFACTWMTILLP